MPPQKQRDKTLKWQTKLLFTISRSEIHTLVKAGGLDRVDRNVSFHMLRRSARIHPLRAVRRGVHGLEGCQQGLVQSGQRAPSRMVLDGNDVQRRGAGVCHGVMAGFVSATGYLLLWVSTRKPR